MNSLKNAVVTAILLAVGYGAYVVLNNPPVPMDQQFQDDQWGPPVEDLEVVKTGAGDNELSTTLPPKPTLEDMGPRSDESAVNGAEEEEGLHRAPPIAGAGPSLPDINPPDTDYPQTDHPQFFEDKAAEESYYASYPQGASTATVDGSALDSTAFDSAGRDTSQPPDLNEFPEITDYPTTGESVSAESQSTAVATGQPGDELADVANDAFEATWLAVMEKLQQDRLDEALLDLSAWYQDDSLSAAQANRCTQKLDQLAGSVIYSNQNYLEPAYQVQPDESFEQLAQRLRVPTDFLARINGLTSPYRLEPGQYIKIVRGPFRAEISRQRQELTMYLGQFYAGRFKVQFGKDAPTQDATFEIGERALGRNFFDRRTGAIVAKDDPANPYGGVWLGLRGDQITTAHNLGLHSRSPNAVPAGGPGSVSLSPRDAADVHAILAVGSKVTVRR